MSVILKLNKLILLFSKELLNLAKVTMKTFRMLQTISVPKKCYLLNILFIKKKKSISLHKGILQLWKDECVFKMGHLCRRNVKLLLNLELSRLNVILAYVDERQQPRWRPRLPVTERSIPLIIILKKQAFWSIGSQVD